MERKEQITDTETSRVRYVGRVANIYGPAIAEVVTYSHKSNIRPVIVDTCSVEVDGSHRYGFPASHGFAAHMPKTWSVIELVEQPATITVETATKTYFWRYVVRSDSLTRGQRVGIRKLYRTQRGQNMTAHQAHQGCGWTAFGITIADMWSTVYEGEK